VSLDLPVIGSKGHGFRTITEPTELPNPYAPELGLDVGVGLKGDLHRRASALAGDALGFGPGAQVAGGFDRHGGALGGSNFEAQRSVGFRRLESQLRAVVHRAAAALNYRGHRIHRADVKAAAGDFHLLEL
jgi:hypothetical protein